jgi:hypothetical protein
LKLIDQDLRILINGDADPNMAKVDMILNADPKGRGTEPFQILKQVTD